MTEHQVLKRPISSKVAAIRQMAQSPAYQRQLEEQKETEAAKAEAIRQASAADAEAQQEMIAALETAGFKVFPDARKRHVTVRLSCTPRTASRITAWVRQQAEDGQ